MTSQLLLLLFLNLAGALGLTYLLYPKFYKDKTQGVLAMFRVLSFFILGLLIINPEIEAINYKLEKPKLVFGIDNSESIGKLSDPSELNEFIAQLKSDQDLNEAYSVDFTVFGSGLSTLSDSLSFSETSTDISKAIDYANSFEEEGTSYVLISDGNQTQGEDYAFKSYSDNINAFGLVVGDTTSYRDSSIDIVNVNSYAYYKNKFPVEVFVSQNSSDKTIQNLTISQGNKVLASQAIEIPAKGSVKTEFTLNAVPVGIKRLNVNLEPLEEEKNTVNNEQAIAVDIIDSRSKVLLIADILHPDIGFFNRVLESNKELEFIYKTTEEVVNLSEYDLVIFYQPQPSFKPLMEQVINKSINRFIIGGSHTDYALLNSLNLGIQKELVSSTEAYSSSLNSDFSLFLVNDLNFKNYPPLKDKFGDLELTQNFSTLLQKELNGIDVGIPQWIFKTDKDVKTTSLFGENLWKWRAKHFVETSSFLKFDQSFQKVIQFLSQTKSKNELVVELEPVINSGETSNLKATYYNSNFETDTRLNFDIELENLETEEVKTSRLLKGKNAYSFDLSSLSPGTYAYKIRSDESELKKEGQFQILNYSSELQFENANFRGLQKLVSSSNIFTFAKRSELISKLKSEKPQSIEKSFKKSQSLINFEWLILLLALTLGIEWFYRKYKGLI